MPHWTGQRSNQSLGAWTPALASRLYHLSRAGLAKSVSMALKALASREN